MRPAAGNTVIALTIALGAVALVLGLPMQRTEGQDTKKTELDPKKVEAQKKTAAEYWKQIFESDKMPLAETAHFLVVGGSAKPGLDAASAGAALEQQFVKASAILQLEKGPDPWRGKLTVFLLPDAKKYPRTVRLLERRKAEEDETGTFDGEGDFPYLAACAGTAPGDLGAAGNAGLQLAALLMTVRVKSPLPAWLNEGFGRATVLLSGPPLALAAERRKVSFLLAKNNRTVDEIFNNTLNADERPYLRASFADFLAYTGKTGKFLPFLDGFRPDNAGNPGNEQIGLKNASLTTKELTADWQKFARGLK